MFSAPTHVTSPEGSVAKHSNSHFSLFYYPIVKEKSPPIKPLHYSHSFDNLSKAIDEARLESPTQSPLSVLHEQVTKTMLDSLKPCRENIASSNDSDLECKKITSWFDFFDKNNGVTYFRFSPSQIQYSCRQPDILKIFPLYEEITVKMPKAIISNLKSHNSITFEMYSILSYFYDFQTNLILLEFLVTDPLIIEQEGSNEHSLLAF